MDMERYANIGSKEWDRKHLIPGSNHRFWKGGNHSHWFHGERGLLPTTAWFIVVTTIRSQGEGNSWTAFLVKVSGHKLESSQTQIFVWFSALIFPFYKMLFMNRLKFSCFAHWNENPTYGIARPQPQFPHSCVCERFIYSQDRSTYFLQQNRQTDCGNI